MKIRKIRMHDTGSGRKRTVSTVSLVLIMIVILAGCGRGATAAIDPADKVTGKGLVIGWSQRSLAGSDWYKTLVSGGQQESSRLGAQLDVLDANQSTIQQIQDVRTLISKNVDVVVLNANDPLGVASAIKDLNAAGIPVVAVNSNLDPKLISGLHCYVAEDQVATGALAGREIAKKAIAKYGESGTIKLVGLGGFPGDVLSELRYRGFLKGYRAVMADYPKVHTVELPFRYGHWLPDQALAPIRDVATANPDLKIVYNESDVMQAGVRRGLQEAGLWGDKLLEGSYDGGMNAVGEMRSQPDGPLQATASNQPYDQGVAAIRMAVAAYNGDRSACPGRTKYIPTTVVTPDNADQYYDPRETHVRAKEQR
ncbi:sugar ABC transporter substrate-binding protein [Microlunatus soli]|uniref:Monosaccharide ABC transporter substrate-binding protein, CUT2 family n=1 Tax=Microlunatus soli TaxID=630515 RepID=A0A1H1Q0Z6_9ACTN|nr:substrate-binding domain-containing protein [Microlunatus soli]SDS17064.1 monosaccharide ABC transporter substrate-binding protein, CUT2 family [Microlunatus soli]